MGALDATSRLPIASNSTTLPCRAIMVTAPDSLPCSIRDFIPFGKAVMRLEDMPTASGFAAGSSFVFAPSAACKDRKQPRATTPVNFRERFDFAEIRIANPSSNDACAAFGQAVQCKPEAREGESECGQKRLKSRYLDRLRANSSKDVVCFIARNSPACAGKPPDRRFPSCVPVSLAA